MKKLLLVVLLLAVVACAPGQGTQSVTAPQVETSGGSVTLAGKAPQRWWTHACDAGDVKPEVLICDMDFLQPELECCQTCSGGTFKLLGTCP